MQEESDPPQRKGARGTRLLKSARSAIMIAVGRRNVVVPVRKGRAAQELWLNEEVGQGEHVKTGCQQCLRRVMGSWPEHELEEGRKG